MEEEIITKVGGFSFLGFLKKHWKGIILMLILLPHLIIAINNSIKSDHPIYPFFYLGGEVVGADNILNNKVEIMRIYPDNLIKMDNPESGLWKHIIYYTKWTIAIFAIIGDIILIFLPFHILYLIFKSNNPSTKGKNIMISLMIFLVFMFIVNSIFTIDNILKGRIDISIPANISPFDEFLFIGKNILPFHGTGNLIMYIIGKIIGV